MAGQPVAKHPGGRPHMLTPELMAKAKTFLDVTKDDTITRRYVTRNGVEEVEIQDPPTITKFALFLGTTRETLHRWSKESAEFLHLFNEVKHEYEQALAKNGLSNAYDAGLAKFLLSADHDKRERSEVRVELPKPILGFEEPKPDVPSDDRDA